MAGPCRSERDSPVLAGSWLWVLGVRSQSGQPSIRRKPETHNPLRESGTSEAYHGSGEPAHLLSGLMQVVAATEEQVRSRTRLKASPELCPSGNWTSEWPMTMISPMMKHCLPMMVCVLMLEVEVLPGAAATGEDVRFHLRPSKAFVEAQSKHGMAMPFFRAVPFAPGRLKGPDTSLALSVEGKAVPADVRPSAFWPDASVQWLSIDGVWPRGRQVAEEMVASVRASAVASKGSPCSITVNRGALGYQSFAFCFQPRTELENAVSERLLACVACTPTDPPVGP